MNWLDYRNRLGLDFEDEEKGAFCTSLILNKLKDLSESRRENLGFYDLLDFEAVSKDEFKVFCAMTGTEYGDTLSTPEAKIYQILTANKLSFKKFIAYCIAFINCLSNRAEGIKQSEILELLDKAFIESRLKYALLKDDDKYYVFPKGAKELDDALVSEPLEWLQQYPLSRKEWIIALKAYANIPAENPSEVADKFRKALERFFQEFFESEKSLENLKSEYGSFLSSKGVPATIKNNFEKILDLYTNYMNNYAKHHDRTGINVLEYILYQTGNLIRLLITLEKEE